MQIMTATYISIGLPARRPYGCMTCLARGPGLSVGQSKHGGLGTSRHSAAVAGDDEKDLSTTQPPSFTDARIHGPHGHAGRKKHPQAPPRQGAPALDHNHSSQAAGLDGRRSAVLVSNSAGFGAA